VRLYTLGVLLLIAPAGCLRQADAFARKGARLGCKRIEACNNDFFETEYSGDASLCRDDIENNSQFSFDALEAMGCTYQPDEARACIRATRRNKDTCGDEADAEIDDACRDVFDCSDAGP